MTLKIGTLELDVASAEEVYNIENENNKFFSLQLTLNTETDFEELMMSINEQKTSSVFLDDKELNNYKLVNATRQFSNNLIVLFFKKTI